MSKSPARVSWEFGDTTLWVSFGSDDKPFPVSVFRKRGKIDFKVHPYRELSEEENEALLAFMKQREMDILALWPEAFKVRLSWSKNNLRRKK